MRMLDEILGAFDQGFTQSKAKQANAYVNAAMISSCTCYAHAYFFANLARPGQVMQHHVARCNMGWPDDATKDLQQMFHEMLHHFARA